MATLRMSLAESAGENSGYGRWLMVSNRQSVSAEPGLLATAAGKAISTCFR